MSEQLVNESNQSTHLDFWHSKVYTDIKAIHLTLLTDSGFFIKSIIISCERDKEKEKWLQTEHSSSLQRGLINMCQSAGRSAVELLMWQCPAASVPANYQ